MAKKDKGNEEISPRELIERYVGIKKAEEKYAKNPHDVIAMKLVSQIEGTPQEFLRNATPTEVGEKIIETKMALLKEIGEKLSYDDLLKEKDVYELLKELPPLKLGKERYSELANAHANYFLIEKMGELDKGEKRAQIAKYLSGKTGKESDYYLAWAARDIDALYIGIKFEAERELKKALEKLTKKGR